MKKILIIDDDILIFSELELIFQKNGISTEYCDNPGSAVDYAVRNKPDCILLDIVMPGKNGFEVLSDLKVESETIGIPVILISSLMSVEEKRKGFISGAVDYITKPFLEEEVLLRVNTHMILNERNKQLINEIVFKDKLIDSMPIGIGLIDGEQIIPLNKFTNMVLGFPDDYEVISLDSIIKNDLLLFQEKILQVINNVNIEPFNMRLETADKRNVSVVLFCTNFEGVQVVIALFKEVSKNEFIYGYESEVIINVLNSLKFYADQYIDVIRNTSKSKSPISDIGINLNETETDIVKLIIDGYTNKEISSKLCLSDIYIRKKISEIYKKTNVGSRIELINHIKSNFLK